MPPSAQPEIRVGQTWVDNDPRMRGRELVVTEVGERYVHLRNPHGYTPNQTRIMRKFFRPAGKVYRTGFSLKEK